MPSQICMFQTTETSASVHFWVPRFHLVSMVISTPFQSRPHVCSARYRSPRVPPVLFPPPDVRATGWALIVADAWRPSRRDSHHRVPERGSYPPEGAARHRVGYDRDIAGIIYCIYIYTHSIYIYINVCTLYIYTQNVCTLYIYTNVCVYIYEM